MTVDLLTHTLHPETIVAIAARICKSNAADVVAEAFARNNDKLIRSLIAAGHGSVLEHVSFTFLIEGISRSCLAQPTRHRVALYSVRSQRYCDESEPGWGTPKSVLDNAADPVPHRYKHDAATAYNIALDEAFAAYRNLVALGVPKEDARYVLPEATATRLVLTMNVRELRHFFKLRRGKGAQREIRQLADAMLELCRGKAPLLFEGVDE